MESVEEIEEERVYEVEETIFVAVGKNVEKSKTTLFWAVQSFTGKKICVLHVHQPEHAVALMEGKFAVNKLKQNAVKAFQELERRKMHETLNKYLLILDQAGVQADKIWIERDNVGKGIVEIIAQHNIRWLVMGAAADKYFSKKLVELKSKKAIFVCQKAPIYCHIWFACKGCLIYTRGGREDISEIDILPSLLLLDSEIRAEQPELLKSESVTHRLRSLDAEDDADILEGTLSFASQCAVNSDWSNNRVVGSSIPTTLLTDEAKALKSLCVREMSKSEEMEELLAREKQEVEQMKNQHDEFMKELQMVQDQKSVLERQLAESKFMAKELEEKIISAVELLISFKKKRDDLRIEHGNVIREVKEVKKLVKVGAANYCGARILAFSFVEINEATHNFDPSCRIGEGRYGSVYKGLLHHMCVAIKMLPSYGSQLEFQNEVEVWSRVRHPNLVTLVGTCPESRSLVYEYLRNGSLEDRLACKDNTRPLPWHIRTHIASDICSALIFLHSSKPCITHGNLKPSKVLLDTNFVCKLGDVGIYHLIPQAESTAKSTALCNEYNPKVVSVYMDPEYLETGRLTPESDVYSFGIILLRLLTGRPVSGILKDVKCALEKENFAAVLDDSAGDWPLELAKQLAYLALGCCEKSRLNRPDLLSEIWSVLEPMRASCIHSASYLGSKELRRIPSHFVCPIFQEVMNDPQIAADGFTYEGDAIRGWLKSGHNTSPMTNLKLGHCDLLPNYALHQAIQEWQQQW